MRLQFETVGARLSVIFVSLVCLSIGAVAGFWASQATGLPAKCYIVIKDAPKRTPI